MNNLTQTQPKAISSELAQKISQALEDQKTTPASVAKECNVSEQEVVKQLSTEQVTWLNTDISETLLNQLPNWGKLTTIIQMAGNIFEFKGDFPKGKPAHGYFNLFSKGDGLHGHLLLSSYHAIALISRPFMGRMSHAINFFDDAGNIIFKVYLGRDKSGELIADQVNKFDALKQLAK